MVKKKGAYFILWECPKCGEFFQLSKEDDKITTKMWCCKCGKQMSRKDRKNEIK